MIITYGAYCSNTLDKNYIPITLKYLELYIISYSLDDVLAELSKNSNKTFVKAGSKRSYRIQAESENIYNDKEIVELSESDIKILPFSNLLTEQTGSKTHPGAQTGNAGMSGVRGKGNTVRTAPKQPKPNTKVGTQYAPPPQEVQTKIGDINRAVISIEPTWIQVTYNDATFLLGVKVVPIFFKDDDNIVKEIMKDSSFKPGISLLTQQFIRFWKGFFRNAIEKSLPGRVVKTLGWEIFDKNTPEGIKIRNKIIYATSSFGRNLFMILNKNSFSEDMSEKSYSRVIGTLKWCSLIFMDDVNQQISFCMKKNKGYCSVVPYRVLIHSTLNKTMGQAYQDIDDVQSAVSSVFRMNGKRITKILGEMTAAFSLIDLRKHLIESLYLQENTENYLANPNLAIEMFKKIRFISKMSDLTNMQNKLEKFPVKTPNEIHPFIEKNSNNFKKLYNFSRKVIKNSVNFELSDNDLEILSYIIAYRSANMRGPNQIPRLRDLLKSFVYKLRKNEQLNLDNKIIIFRTIVDIFNESTSILKYHDFDSDDERQKIILRNLYVFLSLTPLLILK